MRARPKTRVLQQQPKQQQQSVVYCTGTGLAIPQTPAQTWQALARSQASKQQTDL